MERATLFQPDAIQEEARQNVQVRAHDLGTALVQAGDVPAARKVCGKYCEADVLVEHARVLLAKNETEGARAALVELAAIGPAAHAGELALRLGDEELA